jgi:hypothetical protein
MMKWPSGVLVNMQALCASSGPSAEGKYFFTGARSSASSAGDSPLLRLSGLGTTSRRWRYTPSLKPAAWRTAASWRWRRRQAGWPSAAALVLATAPAAGAPRSAAPGALPNSGKP